MFSVDDFGLADYADVWAAQRQHVEARIRGEIPDGLLLGEHPSVVTCGRGVPSDWRNPTDWPAYRIERGGQVTYHGPGQLVVYPILSLAERKDLGRLLRDLESVVLLTLADFGLKGVRNPGWTGVWLPDSAGRLRKVCSIGVAVRRWVSYHGIGLNVSTDLTAFRDLNPCGLDGEVMTSMQATADGEIPMAQVKQSLIRAFCQVFDGSAMMTSSDAVTTI
jgi:lipoate-protein ligase B